VICAKAKELVAQGVLGDLMLVEGTLGRNDPDRGLGVSAAPRSFPQTLDWDTWQGTVPKRAFDPLIFARWRCWKEYGTGVAGDLLVHLVSGMQYVLGINEAPNGPWRWAGSCAGRMAATCRTCTARSYNYGEVPVYMRLSLGTETPETYRFQGSKGILELTEFSLTYTPQRGGHQPELLRVSFPRAMREEYFKKWHQEHDAVPGKEPAMEGTTYRSVSWDDVKNRICGISSRRCARASRWWKTPCLDITRRWLATWRTSRISARRVTWDEESKTIKS
jgi:predicted dehydrogenase